MSADRPDAGSEDAGRSEAAPDLERLVDRFLPEVRQFVRLRVDPRLRQREADSDIVQSVCRELVEDWDRLEYRGETAFRAWLFTAALNKIREKGRFHGRARRDRAREADQSVSGRHDGTPSPSQFAIGGETADQLERIMDRMPEDYRTVITLCRVAKLPHAVVAEQMGRSVGAVRQLLGRALLALSTELRNLDGPPSEDPPAADRSGTGGSANDPSPDGPPAN